MEDIEIQEVESKKRSFRRYRKNLSLIDRLEKKLELLELRISSPRSPKFSDMPRGGKPVTTEELILEKIELEDRIKRLRNKGRNIKTDILAEIDTLEDDRYAEVLESYFIDGYTIEEIADIKGYSTRHVYKLYADAITLLVHKDNSPTTL